jgi:DNA-binding transcriptional regulator PaaX
MVKNGKKMSTKKFLLLAIVPYSQPGLMLAYKPSLFFNELERLSGTSSATFRVAFSRAKQSGLITQNNNNISLSLRARQIVQPFVAQKLPRGVLVVMFDIPEDLANKRQQLRLLLKELRFKQIQKSVWSSDMDYREIMIDTIDGLSIQDYVMLYEAARID